MDNAHCGRRSNCDPVGPTEPRSPTLANFWLFKTFKAVWTRFSYCWLEKILSTKSNYHMLIFVPSFQHALEAFKKLLRGSERSPLSGARSNLGWLFADFVRAILRFVRHRPQACELKKISKSENLRRITQDSLFPKSFSVKVEMA